MNRVNWKAVSVFSVIVVIVFLVGLSLFGGSGYGNWGMMGPGMMGGCSYGTFGWAGMIFMWLIPISFLVLILLGIVWLLNSVIGGGNRTTVHTQPCPDCRKSVQPDWQNCPYCGTALNH